LQLLQDELVNQIEHKLWEQGRLKFLLQDHQMDLWGAFHESKSKKFVLNCSRRYGKSYLLCILAIEHALKNQYHHVRFAAPTQKQLREIIQPIMDKILLYCPDQFRPIFKSQESLYFFPITNSYIHIAGCDNGNDENLRGHESHFNIIDEAGFIDNLEYLIKDILQPQTLTTGGRTIISSTPPNSPDHYFHSLCQEAKKENYYIKKTIYDNSMLPIDVIEEYKKEAGGESSSTWRREYLCEFVVDESRVIIPEWEPMFIQDSERDSNFQFYHKYASMDIGGRDKTVIVFGYYDFMQSKLYIEDEAVLSKLNTTTNDIALAVKDKESTLEYSDMRMRVADNNALIMLNDLLVNHELSFFPTKKDELHSMVNRLRVFIADGRLRVHSRCKEVIGCLESAIWNKQRRQFDRSSLYGHYDALAALIYLMENLDQWTNPIPALHGIDKANTFGYDRLSNTHDSKENLLRAFKKW
jgi:hypothetical protein